MGIRIRDRILINLRNHEAIDDSRPINQGANHNKAPIKAATNSRVINQVVTNNPTTSKADSNSSQVINQVVISNKRNMALPILQRIGMVPLRWAWMPTLQRESELPVSSIVGGLIFYFGEKQSLCAFSCDAIYFLFNAFWIVLFIVLFTVPVLSLCKCYPEFLGYCFYLSYYSAATCITRCLDYIDGVCVSREVLQTSHHWRLCRELAAPTDLKDGTIYRPFLSWGERKGLYIVVS